MRVGAVQWVMCWVFSWYAYPLLSSVGSVVGRILEGLPSVVVSMGTVGSVLGFILVDSQTTETPTY